jgi:uncharacterized iron-regulated membrane protein
MGNSGAGLVSQWFDVHAAFGLACLASVLAAAVALRVREPGRL